ncbi:MAG: dihydropyrimidinase [Oscillospiraceae bacterium]|jgi:D-hydantoinase|nr:dihydropyrimidinase [Oscillospiraceae bacterium]
MNTLIKNGLIVNANSRNSADIFVENSIISEIGKNIPDAEKRADEIVDATGLLVLPGAIDVHTHFELPFGNAISADDFFTGTRAAACGGVTTIMDFVTPEKGESLMDALVARRKLADSKVCIDYGLHVSLPGSGYDGITNRIEEMLDVVAAGITSFKVFMTYAFRATDDEFKAMLSKAKELDALIMVHAEDHKKLEELRAKFIAEGKTDAWHHYLSRPENVETKGVETAIKLAKETNASLYIVHLASAGGLKAVERAKKEGVHVFAETCPQYLHFTNDVYKQSDGQNYVCSPPIKSKESREALWEGIKSGLISTVATDHCPFTLEEKLWGKDDFTKIPNGVMGVENLYPYMLSEANKGNISFERVVELCCANPAKIFKLAPKKGQIAVGADADIVLYDPCKDFQVSVKNIHSNTDYTIWENVKLNGYPVTVYSRGKIIYKNGEFSGTAGTGKYLSNHCKSPSGHFDLLGESC